MRKSIKVRLAVSFIGITLLSLLSITAVNRLFLEKYYISRKADSLETVYKALNEQAFNDPEGRTHLQGLCIEKNISWVLVDVSSQDWTIIALSLIHISRWWAHPETAAWDCVSALLPC